MAKKGENRVIIHLSCPTCQERVYTSTKNKKNDQQGFMFRGIDDVMNTIQPLFAKHKLFIVPEILEQTREERTTAKGNNLIYSICKIKYTFYAEDGSNIQATVIGEGMDSGDKATNKAMAIGMKYALFQVFCIPTEEMKDPDAETHDVKPKAQSGQAVNKTTPGATEEQIKIIKEKYTDEELAKLLPKVNKTKVEQLNQVEASKLIKLKEENKNVKNN